MFEAHLLGQFDLRLDGASVELPSRPAQSLLAYLLLHHRVQQRRELVAGVLWPDSSEANARRNLRQALWQIRRALGAAADSLIQADDMMISVQLTAADRLDVALVDQPLDDTVPLNELLERVAAYGGELLPGFYDDWVVLAREQIAAHCERTMDCLLTRLVAAAHWPAVLHWGERWIALGQTPEAAFRALMVAYAVQGEMAAMAEVYRRCEEALARDLAVEPSEQTQQLYEQLRRGELPFTKALMPPFLSQPSEQTYCPAELPRSNLPVHLTSFIGRDHEIDDLRQMLAPVGNGPAKTGRIDHASRLLTLTGSGGTGKTRLALQIAAGLVEQFADGVWLIELALVTDPENVAQTVAAVLDVREEDCCPLQESIIANLRDKQALLLLDNCEHLLDACAQLADTLLRACPQVKILTTSREMLGLTGETVRRVPSLSLPDKQTMPAPEAMLTYEAIRLFVERGRAVRPEFALTAANAAAIAQICRQLDGVPLSIELAAARVRAMTPDQIAARLDDRFRLLNGGSRTALPRQQSLRALIDWSWDLLSAGEKRLLQCLAVFRGGWTLEAAEAICGDAAGLTEQLHPHDLLDLLTHLVDKSLVIMQEQAEGVRYDLLETIRQYALDQLIAAGDVEALRARHLAYFVQMSEMAEPKLRTGEQLTWLTRLDLEHDNLRAALKWAASNPNVLAAGLRLAGNLARFWYLRSYWTEGRVWLRTMLDLPMAAAADEAVLRARIDALAGAGWLADEDGSEIPLYRECLRLAEQFDDKWAAAFSLRGLAAISANWTNLEQVAPQLEASLTLFTALQDDWGVALAHFGLGWLALSRNENLAAEQHWQTGLANFRRCGDRWGIAVTVGGLGYLARTYGQYELAGELIHESLAKFRELGDRAGVSLSLTRLGYLAFRRGDYNDALAFLADSMILQRERRDMEGIIASLQVQGLVACYQGQYTEAATLLEESLRYARERNINNELGNSWGYLGFVAYCRNELSLATDFFQQSLACFTQDEDREGIAFAGYGLGIVAYQRGDYEAAADWLNQSLLRLRSWRDNRYITDVLDAAGLVALARGDRGMALAYTRDAFLLRHQMVDKQGFIESLEHFAAVVDEPAQAVRWLACADRLRQRIGAPVPLIDQPARKQLLAAAQAQLGAAQFAAAWHDGETQSLETTISSALAFTKNYVDDAQPTNDV